MNSDPDIPSRRSFLSDALAVGVASQLPAAAKPAGAPGDQRPSILYIHSHDSGRYLAPYGHAVPTPNLLRLAKQGVLFRQAYSGAPTCSPSRACLLTGQYAHQNGMLGLVNWGFRMPNYSKVIVHPSARRRLSDGLRRFAAHCSQGGDDRLRSAAAPSIDLGKGCNSRRS